MHAALNCPGPEVFLWIFIWQIDSCVYFFPKGTVPLKAVLTDAFKSFIVCPSPQCSYCNRDLWNSMFLPEECRLQRFGPTEEKHHEAGDSQRERVLITLSSHTKTQTRTLEIRVEEGGATFSTSNSGNHVNQHLECSLQLSFELRMFCTTGCCFHAGWLMPSTRNTLCRVPAGS